jgi:hypothetical protein
MTFVLGFLSVIFLALLGEIFFEYSGVKDLAAIFSGWITAVLGFYFLQQKVETAEQREHTAVQEAREAKVGKTIQRSKLLGTVAASTENLIGLMKELEEYRTLTEELISELKERKEAGKKSNEQEN